MHVLGQYTAKLSLIQQHPSPQRLYMYIPYRLHPIQTTSHTDNIPYRLHPIQTTSHTDYIPYRLDRKSVV